MNKEEYYNRINKITTKISTDRVSKDEEFSLICQKNYLAMKYIESLEQENNHLKEQRQELRSWLEEEIKEEYRLYKEFLRIGVIKGETKLTSQFKRVLSKLNELEGKNE